MTEAQALERLRLILARPEFQPQARPFWERWYTAVRDWLADRLLDLLDVLRGVSDVDLRRLDWVQALALLVALGAAGAIAVYVARGVGLSVSREARLRGAVGAGRRARSDRLWEEGQALARSGRFAEACQALYLSALYALEEHGLVRVEEAQTNREHADRAVRADPGLADTFDRLVQRYDRLRYGQYAVDQRVFDEISALVGRTRASRPQGA